MKLIINGITIKEEFSAAPVKTEVEEIETLRLECDIKCELVPDLIGAAVKNETVVKDEVEEPPESQNDDGILKCYYCNNYETKRKFLLLQHVRVVHNNGKCYKCDQCSFTAINKRDLSSHKKTHWGIDLFKCNDCEFRCALKNQLAKHVKKHAVRAFHCDVCNFKTFVEQSLLVHKYTHAENKLFKCRDCCKSFGWKMSLKMHCKRVNHKELSTEPEFTCASCKDYTTDTKDKLVKHMKTVHKKKEVYKCNKCDYESVLRRDLLGHQKIHLNIKLYECGVCEYRSPSKNKWKRHITLVHSKYKTIQCDLCQFKTDTESSLLVHKSIHREEQPFKCEDCGVSYNLKKSFMDHCKRRGHMVNRLELFRCDQCEYATDSKMKFSWHVKVHSDVELFECKLCEYKCYSSYYLSRHQKKHSKLQQVVETCTN